MNPRVRYGIHLRTCLVVIALISLLGPTVIAQEGPKAPVWSYAFDLSCRKFGEPQFTKDTKKYGVEVFKDLNNNFGVYIAQSGDIGVVSSFPVNPPLVNSKAPIWTSGLDLKARKAGELEFTDKTKTFGLEVFFDENTKNWIYICESGNIGVTSGNNTTPKDLKSPEWLYSFDLKCRKGGVRDWDKDVKVYGVEVYRDANNNNLVYICETGDVAVILDNGTKAPEGKGKDPEWLHGQDLQCRKFGEKDFTKDTRKIGVEIFRDPNNGNLVFLSETGNLAVVGGNDSLKAPTPTPSDAKFTHGLDLSVRQAGETDFTEKTKTYAQEIFAEENINATLYVTETGVIAAAKKS